MAPTARALLLPAGAAAAAAGGAWPCFVVAPARPSPADATEVHPGHISVAMAMGDSMSAAFAARPGVGEASESLGEPFLPLEYRSLAFSGGEGGADAWTLPFFLRHYNDSLSGFSTRMTLPQTPSLGYLDEGGDRLNAALSNAHSWQLMMQVEELIKQSQTVERFGDRWKLLTLLIGANDLCDGMPADLGGLFAACSGNATVRTALADRYEQNLRAALEKIRDTFGRIIVQLVSLFSIASVAKAREGHPWCGILAPGRRLLDECPCVDKEPSGSAPPSQAQLSALEATTEELNSRLGRLVAEFNLQRPDFAVIEQAALRGQPIPDASYLSAIDCFHPSAMAHRGLAVTLWNGLFNRSWAPARLNASLAPVCPGARAAVAVAAPGPAEAQRLLAV